MTRSFAPVIAILVCCSHFTFSQVRIGAHGGVNLADIQEPSDYEAKGMWHMRPYVQGGITCDIALSPHWIIATQVNYIKKGMITINHLWGLPYWGNTEVTGNYIEIPIAVRWRIGEQPIRWFVEGGPSFAFLESAYLHSVWLQPGSPVEGDDVSEISGAYAKTEMTLTIGLGGEYNLTESLYITVSVHYAQGITEVFKRAWEGTRSQGVQFDLGLAVSL
jgi:hypothetical protein